MKQTDTITFPLSRRARALLAQYPPYYTLPVGFGLALFAAQGSHRGASFGHYSPPVLTLYGPENFQRRGGLAWQFVGEHERITLRTKRAAEKG